MTTLQYMSMFMYIIYTMQINITIINYLMFSKMRPLQ